MHAYLLVPLFAMAALSGLGCAILAMGPDQAANRRAATLVLGGALWAGCEVLWNSAADAESALLLHRLCAPGWVFLAPFALHLLVEVTEKPLPSLQRLVPSAYAAGSVFLALTWGSPWMLARMERVAWGYALVPGPAFAAWTLFTLGGLAYVILQWSLSTRSSDTYIARAQGLPVTLGVGLGAAVGGTTDILLPQLGIQAPRLGSLGMAGAAVLVAWALQRYGYARLTPQAFANRVLQTLPDAVALTTLHGRIRMGNERLAELLGTAVASLPGRPIGPHLDAALIDPPRERRDVETELRRPGAPPIPVAVTTAPLTGGNAIGGVVLILRDLREIAALRQGLITSGRLAAVGELAAGIAHEINNPLAFVRANLALLRREAERFASDAEKRDDGAAALPEEWEEILDESIDGVDRAVTIVRDIREFSHSGRSVVEPARLDELLDQVLRVAGPQLPAGTRIVRDYGDVPPVPCDPQRLKQLFLNLVVNAGQAMEGAGEVRVRTRAEGDHALISVEDDGCGIPADRLERIFDPFYTTKPVGRGTGLGLSISHEIARAHGGRLWCESEPGVGSAFHLRLPL